MTPTISLASPGAPRPARAGGACKAVGSTARTARKPHRAPSNDDHGIVANDRRHP